MKGVRNRGLIHVDDVTWIFPFELRPHEFNEMSCFFLCFLEVFLCSVSSHMMRQTHSLDEASNSRVSCQEQFLPKSREQASRLLTNHTGTDLYTTVPCMHNKLRLIVLDDAQQTGRAWMNLMSRTVHLVRNVHIAVLQSVYFCNCILETSIIHVGQTYMRTCYVIRNSSSNDGIDGMDEVPFLFNKV